MKPARGGASDVNAALFCNFGETGFLSAALAPFLARPRPLLVTGDAGFLPQVPPERRIGFAGLGLLASPLDGDDILARLRVLLSSMGGIGCVVVDMGWQLCAVHGASAYETWGEVAEALAMETGAPVLSLYEKELMIEDQMQAAFRAHRQILAPSGVYENPFWLPPSLLRDATLDEQMAFLLGRVAPDYAGESFFRDPLRQAARGAAPDWAARQGPAAAAPGGGRWRVRCLGPLELHVGDRAVDWRAPGGAAKKTRALFAYLLHRAEKGAHADMLAELLWPEGEADEKRKRARLHHAVAVLRKVLGAPEAVLRSGEYYRLDMPVGSWIDIASFEQLCRRGKSLIHHGERPAALRVYAAAERIYRGDLFEDLPRDAVETEIDDWVLPRRIWLREMALKLQIEMSQELLRLGRAAEALEHATRAMALDPGSETAAAEAMRALHAQGRGDAVRRLFRQHLAAVGGDAPGLREVYQRLQSVGGGDAVPS